MKKKHRTHPAPDRRHPAGEEGQQKTSNKIKKKNQKHARVPRTMQQQSR
jgi:hypothetical protein